MNFSSINLKEKVRDVDFTNPTINRLAHYSNILEEKDGFIKDNAIRDFSLLNSSNKIQIIDPFDSQIFL